MKISPAFDVRLTELMLAALSAPVNANLNLVAKRSIATGASVRTALLGHPSRGARALNFCRNRRQQCSVDVIPEATPRGIPMKMGHPTD
ncbi:MAG: hypothetical protein IPF47_24535 [Gemmatimonadetes bacterium]|nr:hypothetical protein [Gemmatimonadota bacterium]